MEEINTQSTLRWYESNAKQYAKNIADKISLDQINDFIKLLPKKAKVLDAGCAAGRDVKIFTKAGLVVTGVDISKNLLKIAKKANPKCEFVNASFLSLPFPDDAFDGLWSRDSLIHFENKNEIEKAVSEFARVVKMGGWIHFFVKAQIGQEKTSIKKDAFTGQNERFLRYYTESEVEELLRKNGFKLKSIKQMAETDFIKDGRKGEVMILALAQKK